jgi:hypothetical protein
VNRSHRLERQNDLLLRMMKRVMEKGRRKIVSGYDTRDGIVDYESWWSKSSWV